MEIKDLAKQFLTVVAAVLAVSVTFSEKIVNFDQAAPAPRILLMSAWGLCLLAFVLGGCAIFLIYNAGAAAKYTVLYQTPHGYRKLIRLTYLCLDAGGVSFVLALLLLVLTGVLKMI